MTYAVGLVFVRDEVKPCQFVVLFLFFLNFEWCDFGKAFELVQRHWNERYVPYVFARIETAVCSCVRTHAPVKPTLSGQVTRRWAAVQPRYSSAAPPPPSDRQRESPAQNTPVSCAATDAQQTRRTAPRNTTAMGDRVALLLLAAMVSALAAEVGLLPVLCENVTSFFSSPYCRSRAAPS